MGIRMLQAAEYTGSNLVAHFAASMLQKVKSVISPAESELNENLQPRLRPGWWFWAAMFIGLAIRIYLVVFTEGTDDIGFWQQHAAGVRELGLIGYYHANNNMNHPPFISVAASLLLRAAEATGIPFRVLFRTPFAIIDAGTAMLLLYMFRNNRYRFAVCACYWLYPLTMILSAYHGNTDSSMAFFLMLCLCLLSKEREILAGAALGVSLWIKLPVILAIPAFVFVLPNLRKRLSFLAIIGIVGVSTYMPAIFKDPLIVYRNIFGYHGMVIQSAAGIPIWGTRIFIFPFLEGLSPQWHKILWYPLAFLMWQSWSISILLIILLSWLRRFHRTTAQLGTTIAAVYAILYGFSNYCSFQYFSWSIPFWFFAPPVFLIGAILLTGGYIYSLYWLMCGNGWLLGKWDFVGHPYWPPVVIHFRNLAVLFFFISGCTFLIAAVYERTVCCLNPVKDKSYQPKEFRRKGK